MVPPSLGAVSKVTVTFGEPVGIVDEVPQLKGQAAITGLVKVKAAIIEKVIAAATIQKVMSLVVFVLIN